MNNLKPIEHKIKISFFTLFQSFLKKRKENIIPLDGKKINKLLIIRHDKIGDMLSSFPFVDGLKQNFPDVEISILGSPKNIALIKDDPRFKNIYLYTKHLFKDLKTFKKIRKENYDCVIDLICNDSVTGLFLSQILVKDKPRIGVGKDKYSEYYDYNYYSVKEHVIENIIKLFKAFNVNSEKISGYAPPFIDQKSIEIADKYINFLRNGTQHNFIIGYNLSAGSPTRVWKIERSIELIKLILDFDKTSKVVLFTIPSERDRGLKILETFKERVFIIPDKLSLIEASAIIKELDLLISPDTSLIHIARSFKVKVIGLYSQDQKNIMHWRPYGQEYGMVISKNNDNIHDITPSQVLEEFIKVTGKKK